MSSASRFVAALQELALQHGCIHLLVQQTHSTDAEMRLSAVWALQNLAYQAGPAVHQSLMDKLPWQHTVALLSDSDRRVQVSQLARPCLTTHVFMGAAASIINAVQPRQEESGEPAGPLVLYMLHADMCCQGQASLQRDCQDRKVRGSQLN